MATAAIQANLGEGIMQSSGASWTGRILSGLITAFMLFDGVIKVVKSTAAVQGTVQLGYQESTIVPIGVVALICVILYAVPRTSILGAILLTGYFGGATATQVRVGSPWFVFPVILGAIAWAGLLLRDEQARRVISLRS